MTALLHAELIKLRTTRTFLALAGVAVGTSLLLALLVSLLTQPTEDSVLNDVFTSDTTGLFILILAVVGISGEWRHRTITSSLLAAPDRLRFLAAKTVAFAVAGLALSLAISIAVAIAGFAILTARDLPTPDLGELATQIGRNAVVAMLLGALGVCLGALVRNQVVAIVGVLIVVLVIEPLLITLEPEVGRFMPFTLTNAVAGIPEEDSGVGDGMDLPSPGLAAVAMLTWIGGFYAAGATLLRRRDLD